MLPLEYFSKNKKGDLISRMSSDVNEVQNSFLSIIEIFIRDPLTIIFTLGAMFIIMSLKHISEPTRLLSRGVVLGV